MKARLLNDLLNNPGYIIQDCGEYIAVGSRLCHDLIKVEKESLKLTYALDFNNENRLYLVKKAGDNQKDKLLLIWDKLTELIKSGEIVEIINGKDKIINPLPVFTVLDGVLIESKTDFYGWPNIDDNGVVMYNNTHFKTSKEAVLFGVQELELSAESLQKTVDRLSLEIKGFTDRRKSHLEKIKELKNQISVIYEEIPAAPFSFLDSFTKKK